MEISFQLRTYKNNISVNYSHCVIQPTPHPTSTLAYLFLYQTVIVIKACRRVFSVSSAPSESLPHLEVFSLGFSFLFHKKFSACQPSCLCLFLLSFLAVSHFNSVPTCSMSATYSASSCPVSFLLLLLFLLPQYHLSVPVSSTYPSFRFLLLIPLSAPSPLIPLSNFPSLPLSSLFVQICQFSSMKQTFCLSQTLYSTLSPFTLPYFPRFFARKMAAADSRRPMGIMEVCLRVQERNFLYLREVSVFAPTGYSVCAIAVVALVDGCVCLGLDCKTVINKDKPTIQLWRRLLNAR